MKSFFFVVCSRLDSNGISSSDTENDEMPGSSTPLRSTFQATRTDSPRNSTNRVDRMVVQTSADEEKLKSIKQNVQNRPQQQQQQRFPSPRRTRAIPMAVHIPPGGSSDDVDSLYDQSTNYTDRTSSPSIALTTQEKYPERNLSIEKITGSSSQLPNQMNYIQPKRHEVDCASVTSSEWGADSERGESVLQRHNASLKREYQINRRKDFFYYFVYLPTGNPGSRSHLMGSLHSLREAANRITKSNRSTSRTSMDSDRTSRDDQSTKASDPHTKSSMYPTWSSG